MNIEKKLILASIVVFSIFSLLLLSNYPGIEGYITIGAGSQVQIIGQPVESGGGGGGGGDGGGAVPSEPPITPTSSSAGPLPPPTVEPVDVSPPSRGMPQIPIGINTNITIGLDVAIVSASLLGATVALVAEESILWEVIALVQDEEEEEVAEFIEEKVEEKIANSDSKIIETAYQEWQSFRKLLPR